MAENITLQNLANLQNDTTTISVINNNNAIITSAFTDVLSRTGVQPNQMGAALDMNSFPIINLPAPGSANSPARLVDVTGSNPINISLSLAGDVTAPASSGVLNTTLAVAGTSGHKVPFLDQNNTWSGTNTYSNTSTLNGTTNIAGPFTVSNTSSFTGASNSFTNAITCNASFPFQSTSSTSFTPNVILTNTTNDSSSSFYSFQKSRSGGAVQSGDVLGGIQAQGFANGAMQGSSQIVTTVAGAPVGSVVPSKISLITTTSSSFDKVVTITNGGVVGTTTNDNAAAGNYGEYVSNTLAVGSAIVLTSATPANVTSISLTAGDWDVYAITYFLPAGTTVIQTVQGSVSTTSATMNSNPGNLGAFSGVNFQPGANPISVVSSIRLSLASTTTVFLVAQSTFGTSTNNAYGTIQARRAR